MRNYSGELTKKCVRTRLSKKSAIYPYYAKTFRHHIRHKASRMPTNRVCQIIFRLVQLIS